MRLSRPIWFNLPYTQKDRYSTGTLLGNGWCTRRRRSFLWLLDCNSLGVEMSPAGFTVMPITWASLPSQGIGAMESSMDTGELVIDNNQLQDRSMGWMALNPIDVFTQGFSLGIVKSMGSIANSLSNSSRNEMESPSKIEGTMRSSWSSWDSSPNTNDMSWSSEARSVVSTVSSYGIGSGICTGSGTSYCGICTGSGTSDCGICTGGSGICTGGSGICTGGSGICTGGSGICTGDWNLHRLWNLSRCHR
ncbi:hypothetical protein TNCV_2802651 [Trichonephila clavipes]|nr:hypothetical protein TNCV_2802651 [Trichonephila clavipes]